MTRPLLNAVLCLPRGHEHMPVLDIRTSAKAQTCLPPSPGSKRMSLTFFSPCSYLIPDPA